MKRRSLRREVEATRRELAHEAGARRRVIALTRRTFERTRQNGWLTWFAVLAIAVGMLWAPPLFVVSWPSEQIVERVLPIVWQVQGAAMGLSLAVIVFSFQTFAQSRYAGSLREFAAQSPATPIVVFGLVTLLVDGLAFLGVGRDAPAGWAGRWAIFVSLISIALLPAVLLLLLRGLEGRSLHLARIKRLQRLMGLEVTADLRGRLGHEYLSKACEKEGWDFMPLFGAGVRQGWHEVQSSMSGVVADVYPDVLVEVVAMCAPKDRPVLLVRYGGEVRKEQPVILLPPSADPSADATAQKLVRIEDEQRDNEEGLQDAIKLLHQQALQAFRDRNAVWYDEIALAYRAVLMALPQAWADYGVEKFHRGLTQSFDLVSRPPIELVLRQLRPEFRSAFRSSEPEIVERAISLAYSTLLGSWGVGAEGLSRTMLDLLVYAYQLAASSDDVALAKVGVDRVTQALVEFSSVALG